MDQPKHHHHHHHHRERHRFRHRIGTLSTAQKKSVSLVLALVLIVLLIGAYGFMRRYESGYYAKANEDIVVSTDAIDLVQYRGTVYKPSPNITSFLMIGTDKRTDRTYIGARQGDQADFLQLIVIDWSKEAIHQIQIDRDSITDIPAYGIMGNPVGTSREQICLAQVFGTTPDENCRNSLTAVGNLLGGIKVDNYIMVEMDSIGAVNNALGGVTVTVPEDLTDLDPAFVPDHVVHLTDDQAEKFVHSRMNVGDGTNASRMKRQSVYLNAATNQFLGVICADTDELQSFIDKMDDVMYTNLSDATLFDYVNRAKDFEILPVIEPKGEHIYGEDGFMEFHPDHEQLKQMVMEVFYMPA